MMKRSAGKVNGNQGRAAPVEEKQGAWTGAVIAREAYAMTQPAGQLRSREARNVPGGHSDRTYNRHF
jgi:hypothetical protein